MHIPTEGGQAEITGLCSAGRLKFLSDRRSEPQLIAYVSISNDLKKRTVDNDIQLRCIVSEGSWAIKGDIVQNLQPDKPDCWKPGPPPKASDQELIDIASNTTAGKKYLARYPENDITISRDRDINVGYKVTFTPKISEPIELIINVAGFDREITLTYLICSYGAYRYPQQPEFWSYFEPSNDCLQSVHDKLVVADKTPQAKAFKEKYPGVGLHRVDHSGRFTVTGTDSTIEYKFTGVQLPSNEAHLIIHFRPGTTNIVNFEAQCGPEPTSAGTSPQHTKSDIDLDVARFLQDSYCPVS